MTDTPPGSSPSPAGPGISKFLRWSVERFARGMESRLRHHHRRKGDLPDDNAIDQWEALESLKRHVAALEIQMKVHGSTSTSRSQATRDIGLRALDIGNYAMMIYSRYVGDKSVH